MSRKRKRKTQDYLAGTATVAWCLRGPGLWLPDDPSPSQTRALLERVEEAIGDVFGGVGTVEHEVRGHAIEVSVCDVESIQIDDGPLNGDLDELRAEAEEQEEDAGPDLEDDDDGE